MLLSVRENASRERGLQIAVNTSNAAILTGQSMFPYASRAQVGLTDYERF
jgi:hypothetical protein